MLRRDGYQGEVEAERLLRTGHVTASLRLARKLMADHEATVPLAWTVTRALVSLKQVDEALTFADQFSMSTTEPSAVVPLGFVLEQMGNDERAIEAYQRALAKDEADLDTSFALAQVLMRLNRPGARDLVDKLERFHPHALMTRALRIQYDALTDARSAATAARTLIGLFPSDFEASSIAAGTLNLAADYRAVHDLFCGEALDEAIEPDLDILRQLAYAEAKLGNWELAVMASRRVYGTEATTAADLELFASSLYQLGKYEAAADALLACLQLDGQRASAAGLLVWVSRKLRDDQLFETAREAYIRLAPREKFATHLQILQLLQRGKVFSALAHLIRGRQSRE